MIIIYGTLLAGCGMGLVIRWSISSLNTHAVEAIFASSSLKQDLDAIRVSSATLEDIKQLRKTLEDL